MDEEAIMEQSSFSMFVFPPPSPPPSSFFQAGGSERKMPNQPASQALVHFLNVLLSPLFAFCRTKRVVFFGEAGGFREKKIAFFRPTHSLELENGRTAGKKEEEEG